MNKRHLSVAVIAALALSSSTIASAEGGSHRRMGGYEHISSVAPIGLSDNSAVLTIDTSSTTPSFHFDTSTVSPHIDFDPSKLTTHFDTSTATTNWDAGRDDDGEDDSLPAGLNTPVVPADPNAPATPGLPSWITKPHAKANDDNRDHSDHSSEESQD